MIYRIDVEVVAPVHPTEAADRVADAIRRLFPNAEVERREGEVLARTHSVDALGEALARQRIREAARSRLLAAIDGDTIAFTLDKQAAAAGVANFGVEPPGELGDLAVSIRVEQPDPARLVDWLTGEASDDEGVSP
ncbi:MAG: RNA-binding domain-containing protein [Halobacteriales archaeon]